MRTQLLLTINNLMCVMDVCRGSNHFGELHPSAEGVRTAGIATRLPQVPGRPFRLLRPLARRAAEDGEGEFCSSFALNNYVVISWISWAAILACYGSPGRNIRSMDTFSDAFASCPLGPHLRFERNETNAGWSRPSAFNQNHHMMFHPTGKCVHATPWRPRNRHPVTGWCVLRNPIFVGNL